MRLVLRYIFLSGVVIALHSAPFDVFAQKRCGTVEYIRSRNPNPYQHQLNFEKWLNELVIQQSSRRGRKAAGPYQIPVVVHVVHNGESIGAGANISDAQILSQVKVLNDDFNRQNSDAANTPPEFAMLAGSLDIEFVLARRDPDGLATSGIIRLDGDRDSWTMNDNYALKSLSYWPAEEYFNIWVCNLSSHLGYAQFPESDLDGLENSSTNRLTDGIVVWHGAFGSVAGGAFNLDPRFNKGRTVTHETGHFFGLNHIWGDDSGCNGTDYVADTPNQADRTDRCPTHPKTDACGEVVMFQNFLDYTDDTCMNLFTQGQINRMVTVIENSPRRVTLLTSPGLQDPQPLPNDLGIRTILFPDASVCSNLITPVIEIRNYGNNAVTTARLRLLLDGVVKETRDFALNLDPMESAEISFNAISIPSGAHDIMFEILSTNSGPDSGGRNDAMTSSVIIPAFSNTPLAENFDTPPPGWIIQNPDGQITWQIATAPKETPDNKALLLNYYDYEDKMGEVDRYLSPVFDLTTSPVATLSFEVAHALFPSRNDRLQVIVLTNCQDISNGTVVYDKAGDELATTPQSSREFIPSGQGQWRKELIDLSAFIGTGKFQIAFVGINDFGNNIYLDNIRFFTEETFDLSLRRLAKPAVVTCEENIAPALLIQNAGSITLSSFDVEYAVDGGAAQTLSYNDINLPFAEEMEITLPVLALSPGTHTLFINLKNPNGFADDNPDDNQHTFTFAINQSTDRIPLRQNFDGNFQPDWTIINPEGGMNWQTISTHYNTSLYFNGYDNTLMGDEAWLVSPVLDLSRAGQASLLFDLSYARGNAGEETLTLMASEDCGNTFYEVDFNFPTIQTQSLDWLPQGPEDWKRNVVVDLSALAGKENVRLAFVVVNENGNNLYLDNIEFFTTDEPDPIEIPELYAIYGYNLATPGASDLKITFNLPEKQTVRYTVVSTTGHIETDVTLRDVLNQTFRLDVPDRLAPGIYFIRLQIGGKYYSEKILIGY